MPALKRSTYLSAALLFLTAASLCARFDIPVHEYRLDNGLKVLMVPDTNVAVVSCRLYYFVGSMYEGPGTSGLSHMYEHMMFKGTKTLGTTDYKKEKKWMDRIDSLETKLILLRKQGHAESDSVMQAVYDTISLLLEKQRKYIVKDEQWGLYREHGGTGLNAWTADDMTAYIVTLPRNKIELFYWIESDRMKNPVLREFYSERQVVLEERRMRYDNRPRNLYFERLMATFYTAHPYRLPTIGWSSDIESYTRRKLRSHVERFYTPDNALIVLVGNMDPETEIERIRAYFGRIPASATVREELPTREPQPLGHTRIVANLNAAPRVDLLFHTPGYPDSALYALDVAEGILSGRTGRLYRRLVTDERLCTDVGAGSAWRIGDGYFHIWAMLKEGVSPDTVETILEEEIGRLADTPPGDREIQRVVNSIRMSFVNRISKLEPLSDQLAWFERIGSWKDMAGYPDAIAAVTPQHVPAVVKRWLDPRHKTTGVLISDSSAKLQKDGHE